MKTIEDILVYEVKKMSKEYRIGELEDTIGALKVILETIKDTAMCSCDCDEKCDHCMQGEIHKLCDKGIKHATSI